jgi:subtilisin family serine protease
MRPAAPLALVAVLAAGLPAPAAAQRNLSPRLERAAAQAGAVRVWVFAQPGATLPAIEAAVTARGGRLRQRSRFLHAVSAEVPGTALREIAALREVRRVQPVVVRVRPALPQSDPPRGFRAPALQRAPEDTLYGVSWPYRMLGIAELHQRGLRGAGVRIGVFDTGFNTLHPFMAGATITAERDFVNGDGVVRDQPGDPPGEHTHGTQVWSLLAANAPGVLFGVAPQASYLLAKTEYTPSETRAEEDNWVAALEWADSIGVDIVISSLGYLTFDDGSGYGPGSLTGDIAVTTVAADSAAARGILVVVSAGNGGPAARSLTTPADGDSVIAVGAVDSLGVVAGFSSRGPTTDGRIKPEVAAPGVVVPVAAADNGVTTASGTSFAAPLVAGMAALVQGARPAGGAAVDLRRGLVDGASRRFTPDNNSGFGIPNAVKLHAFPAGVRATGAEAGLLSTLTPTLSWETAAPPPGEGPYTFRLRVGGDSLLAGVLLDTTIATASLTLPLVPRPQTRLFWRVTASSVTGVVESTAVRGPLTVPDWVQLLSLASPQGHSIRDSLPLFVWRSPGIVEPPGPFRYDVQVYPSSRSPAAAVAAAFGVTDTVFLPPRALERNLPFRWRVVARAGADSVVTTSPGTFVVLDDRIPTASVLFQSFPNPFPSAALGVNATCIWFDVAQRGEVRLEVFDLRGRLVKRLAPSVNVSAVLDPGRYGRPEGDAAGTCDPRFQWNGRDSRDRAVRPGVYIYRLVAPGFSGSRRVVFLGER